VAALRQHGLRPRQGVAGRDPQLRVHQVDARDRFGDRMFHLQPCVHFEEIEPGTTGCVGCCVHEKLDRAGTPVTRGFGRPDCCRGDAAAQRVRHDRRRAFLDYLLVPPLDGALPLEQVHDASVIIAEHLHLDVVRPFDQPLHVERPIPERRLRLAARRLNALVDFRIGAHAAHPFATAACRRFDQRGQAHAGDRRAQPGVGLVVRRFPRHDRHTSPLHQLSRFDLGAHPCDHVRGWAHEPDPRLFARGGESRAFREEPIARVNRVSR
jgi:hypothetical protein